MDFTRQNTGSADGHVTRAYSLQFMPEGTVMYSRYSGLSYAEIIFAPGRYYQVPEMILSISLDRSFAEGGIRSLSMF